MHKFDTQPKFDTYLVNNWALFERLKTYCSAVKSEHLVLDIESDSLIEKSANIYGLGLCLSNHKAFYLVWRDKEGNLIWDVQQQQEILAWLKSFIPTKKIIGHNIIYDVLVLEHHWGIKIADYLYHDTILAKHCLDEENPFGLKEVAVAYLGPWADKAKEKLVENIKANGGRATKEHMDMHKADTNVLGEYCCWDVMLTYMLFTIFEEKINEEELRQFFYDEEVMPLYKTVTIAMKRRGFKVDVEYFSGLRTTIQKEIDALEDSVITSVKNYIQDFEQSLLDKDYPVKNAGNFPKAAADVLGIPLPIDKKTNKITLSKKAILQQAQATPQFKAFYDWITEPGTKRPFNSKVTRQIQEKLFFIGKPEQRNVFNLRSNDHLAQLLCVEWNLSPLEKTETGKPKVDDEFLESIKNLYPEIVKIIEFKKLNKLHSTYIEGILERQVDGIIYASMLQFGTTSGRFSSRNPNLQNLPRVKGDDADISPLVRKYTNAIRKGFICRDGYRLVDMDYSSLEPRCFAHMSGDKGLQEIFEKNEDFYSSIAKKVKKYGPEVSTFKKDKETFLGNLFPEIRNIFKAMALAVAYGAEGHRIGELLGINKDEGARLVSEYLLAYPNLHRYMKTCDFEAKHNGMVRTVFGRIRHLKECKLMYNLYGDELLNYKWAAKRGMLKQRREYKNLLNNSKNFKIQGLAAHIVNRAMINIQKEFVEKNLDAHVILQVHDEIIVECATDIVETVKEIMRRHAENVVKLSVPLVAEPKAAGNWAEAK